MASESFAQSQRALEVKITTTFGIQAVKTVFKSGKTRQNLDANTTKAIEVFLKDGIRKYPLS